MGRFSPTVTPTGISPLGAALRTGAQSYAQARERRRKERRAKERAEHRKEILRMRRQEHEMQAARQGYRPEGARTSIPTGDAPRAASGPSESTRGGPRTAADDMEPMPGSPLADRLKTARGETEPTPFTPGDVRQDGTLLPSEINIAAEEAPGRISLPSGGSISEVPPEVQREREERSELVELLAPEMGRRRAEAFARTGTDVLAPPEPEEASFRVTDAQLRMLGATENEIEATRGNQKARQSLVNDLAGDRSNREEGIENTDRFNRAVELAGRPGATIDSVQELTGLSRVQVINAFGKAREGEEVSQTQYQQAANDRFDDPANRVEEAARDAWIQFGSQDAVLSGFDSRIAAIERRLPEGAEIRVPEDAVDIFVQNGSVRPIQREYPQISQTALLEIQRRGLERMREMADNYLSQNAEAMADLRRQFGVFSLGGE